MIGDIERSSSFDRLRMRRQARQVRLMLSLSKHEDRSAPPLRAKVAGTIHRLVSTALALLCLAPAAHAATSEDPDWPCIQRQVPEVSAGMVWAGPPVDGLETTWRQDAEVGELAAAIARRATDLEEAKAKIGAFAARQGADKNEKLTLLFAATLSIVNKERSAIMDGIKRYARRQAKLAKKIEATTADLNKLPPGGGEAEQKARDELEQQLIWDTRIFDERQQSLTYVCETPILLEQRIFALSREIMGQMD